ncbi:toxin-antitoxin system YwqK family antitoxin [Polaribacter sp.]|uniref:toxin-antitoxin system YwqK family antitoxin n=1 Tax=Polaribacter sp. TaxID=1920175 RepID=UPI0025DE2A12|nr:toxin-antitoxin system YwqK family antitoxin [Polaribacter sp.]
MLKIKRLGFVIVFFSYFFLSKTLLAQKINQFNANKKRTGVWKKYYPNKRIRYKGQFKDGKEIGVFKYYDISDSRFPIIIKKFNEENDSVVVSFYSISGKKQSEGIFINKKRVGKWEYYFDTDNIMSVEFYVNDKLNGKVINYYPNGKPTEITNYKMGVKEGLSQKLSSAGILIEEVHYKNDKENGVAKYFELNGNLKETGVYKNGKRIGEWEFYLDGELSNKKALEKENKVKKNNN